jgi:hypothetical protein
LLNGSLIVNAAMPVSGTLQHINGNLRGTGTVTITDKYTWAAGTSEDAGETIAEGGIDITNTIHTLRGRTLTINGSSSWTGGNVHLWSGSTIDNNSTFDIQTDADMVYLSGANTTFINDSVLTKSSGAALTNINAIFANNGSLSVASGSLGLQRTFTQSSTGTLFVDIADGSFDSFAVTQGATLDGTLDINLIGGYQPAVGTMFQIMTCNNCSGAFVTINNQSIGNGTEFQANYNTNDVTLEVVNE